MSNKILRKFLLLSFPHSFFSLSPFFLFPQLDTPSIFSVSLLLPFLSHVYRHVVATSSRSVMEYEEQEKGHVWSVDFSHTEPSMLVSAIESSVQWQGHVYLICGIFWNNRTFQV
ncbi:hypothetical protein I3842_08G092200 [Carya illinoinensis]|uniref:Uncharacterized protein n=1 Tax=Carya illinoinensis TaxID=32201 RepID=A0A922EAN1_CARIL|nr:hypothetical protein I3842_08G092200 [Carya illinoinensis]